MLQQTLEFFMQQQFSGKNYAIARANSLCKVEFRQFGFPDNLHY